MSKNKATFPQEIRTVNILRRHRADGVAELHLGGVMEVPGDWWEKHRHAAAFVIEVTAIRAAYKREE